MFMDHHRHDRCEAKITSNKKILLMAPFIITLCQIYFFIHNHFVSNLFLSNLFLNCNNNNEKLC